MCEMLGMDTHHEYQDSFEQLDDPLVLDMFDSE